MEWNGIKIGCIGVVEEEWIDTVTCFKGVKYTDQAQVATRLAKELREQGAQLIIAVTHSRSDNDIYLAEHCSEIDLILGGHDHDYYVHTINGIPILNSGSNFKQLTLLKVQIHDSDAERDSNSKLSENQENVEDFSTPFVGSRAIFHLERFDITSDTPMDEDMEKIVHESSAEMETLKNKPLGETETVWDCTALTVRTKESAVANFVCDLMRETYECDVAFLQGGTIRSNDTYGPGHITMGDIMKIFPFVDPTVVFEIQGVYLRYFCSFFGANYRTISYFIFREALENGFSKYPSQEGRFPQLSGCYVTVNPRNEPNERVLDVKIERNGKKEDLDDEKLYTVASKGYTMGGGDGYTAFTNKLRFLLFLLFFLKSLMRN